MSDMNSFHNRSEALKPALNHQLASPLAIQPNTSLYMGAEERFNCNVAASIKQEKLMKEQKKMVRLACCATSCTSRVSRRGCRARC
jgi:hypothetical protein